jgi:hypothetical protein
MGFVSVQVGLLVRKALNGGFGVQPVPRHR